MYQPLLEEEEMELNGTGARGLVIRSLPRSSGSFHQHQMSVEESVRALLGSRVLLLPDSAENSGQDLLVIFTSTGRVGDELPAALTDDLKNGVRTVHLAVIQDDEYSRATASCCPEYFRPRSIINLHVVPGQRKLRDSQHNRLALQELQQTYSQTSTWTRAPRANPSAKGLVIRSLPRSSGGFHQRQMSVEESVRAWLGSRVLLLPDSAENSGQDLLVIFTSQGRVGDELPAALTDDLKHGHRTVHLAVIQDDEMSIATHSCCPEGFLPQTVLNLHVIPNQGALHNCSNNRTTISRLQEKYGQPDNSVLSFCPEFVVNVFPCTFPRYNGRLPRREDEENAICCRWYLILCWVCYFVTSRNPKCVVAAVAIIVGVIFFGIIIAKNNG